MRRQKLVWFALGAACTALAALLARGLIPSPDERHVYLSVADRPYSDADFPELKDTAPLSARLFRECGAKDFAISLSSVDKGASSLIRISPDTEVAVRCILERVPGERHSAQIRLLTEQEARSILGQ